MLWSVLASHSTDSHIQIIRISEKITWSPACFDIRGFTVMGFGILKPVVTDTSVKREMYPWASYQIHKIAGCACAGNAGNVFPGRRFKRKPLVSDPGMHHGTCVTHVPWCMSGSLTCSDGENVPGIPGACAPAILRIWQEAHGHGMAYFLVSPIHWP